MDKLVDQAVQLALTVVVLAVTNIEIYIDISKQFWETVVVAEQIPNQPNGKSAFDVLSDLIGAFFKGFLTFYRKLFKSQNYQ